MDTAPDASNPEDEATLVDKIVTNALANSAKIPKVSALVREVATREARRQVRALIRPGAAIPARPADPQALSVFFSTPSVLSPSPTPKPTGKLPQSQAELQTYSRDFFRLMFRAASRTLEDLHPQRIRVFYRLARELARHTRLLEDDQLLAALPLDAWAKPLRAQSASPRYARTSDLLRDGPDLSLLPPASPSELASYDPAQDPTLVHYCEVLEALSEDLEIRRGTSAEPNLGDEGLKGFLEPDLVRIACPSPQEILEWEETLVQDTYKIYISGGTNRAYTLLKHWRGLSQREARPLLKAASQQALDRDEQDIEERRAVMSLRLEDMAQRARQAANIHNELGATKLQALIHGFARTEPENVVGEFTATVKQVASEEEQSKQIEMEDDPNER